MSGVKSAPSGRHCRDAAALNDRQPCGGDNVALVVPRVVPRDSALPRTPPPCPDTPGIAATPAASATCADPPANHALARSGGHTP